MIEVLESRIAPATLIDGKTVSYTDVDGDAVTVTFSLDVLTEKNVNKVFKFDTGEVDGSDAALQFLKTLDLRSFGNKAKGMDVTVDGVGAGDDVANMGFFNAAKIDLGNVAVDGNLQRIKVGDENGATRGLSTLEAGSLGRLAAGDGTRATSSIFGGADTVTILGSVVEAKLQFSGGKFGTANLVEVGGDLIGGAEDKSGAILATGDLQHVHIAGDILGGSGADSGQVGSGRKLLFVEVDGDVVGADGKRSGAILSTKMMGDITLGGDLVGGTSKNSGQIATRDTLGFVEIAGDIIGGAAKFTGAVLSAGGTAGVTVEGDVVGGSAEEAGVIGTAGDLGDVSVGSLIGGSGRESGAVLSTGNMGNVFVAFALAGGSGNRSAHVGAGGNLASFTIGMSGGGGQPLVEERGNGPRGPKSEIFPGLTGGDGTRAGSVQALGFIGDVFISGGMDGGGGLLSGSVIAGTGMGNVSIEGDVNGGSGAISGAIISQNGGIASVEVLGGVDGGSGESSGRISAQNNIGDIYIAQGVMGGTGDNSAQIDSGLGNLGQILIGGSLVGGDGVNSARIISGGSIANLTIFGDLIGGDGEFSALITSFGFLGDVTIDGNVSGGLGLQSGWIFVGSLGNVSVGATWTSSSIITAVGGMGNLSFHTLSADGAGISFATIASADGTGSISASALGDGFSAFDHVNVVAQGNIGDITATVGGNGATDTGILASVFQTGALFASITVDLNAITDAKGIVSSAFNARQNFGNVTVDGPISNSVFVAGIDLGADFVVNPADLAGLGGVFDNAAAAILGFGGTGPGSDTLGSGPSMIGNFILSNSGPNSPGKLIDTIILSGITGAGADLTFGTFDDANIAGSTIGGISAEGGIDPVHVASGSIGFIESAAGDIAGTDSTPNVFIANNPNGTGIGGVTAGVAQVSSGSIQFSSFYSAASIGNISAVSTTGDAIAFSEFIADFDGNGAGSVGNINGETSAELNGSSFNGINEIRVSGASIGDIRGAYFGVSEPGAGIFASEFRAAGDIGNITGITDSTQGVGILDSLFQARGNIGNVEGNAGFANTAIENSAFNAQSNIASVNAIGSINFSAFIAGIHLGDDLSTLGAGNPFESLDDFGVIQANFGKGGTGASSDTTGTGGFIGSISVDSGTNSSGAIYDTSFIAGIVGKGADNIYGTSDDATNTGAFIGPVTAENGFYVSFLQSGQIDSVTVSNGVILGAAFVATSASGPGIGPVAASYTLNNDEGTFGVIEASLFDSNSRIGDITVNISGIRASFGNTISGIQTSDFGASQGIGQVLVDNQSSPAGSDANIGIDSSNFLAGLRGAVGGIAGITVNMPNYTAITNDGIVATLFDASANGTSAGNIGNVVTDRSIKLLTLHAKGNVGDISASTIANTLVTAAGNIGNIGATGVIGLSKFLAGVDLGTNYSFGGTGVAQDSFFGGKSVGTIDAQALDGVDIIASVNPTDGIYGNGNDVSVGNGSFIDKITLSATQATTNVGSAGFAIAANGIGTFTIATVPTALPFNLIAGTSGNDIRVQVI